MKNGISDLSRMITGDIVLSKYPLFKQNYRAITTLIAPYENIHIKQIQARRLFSTASQQQKECSINIGYTLKQWERKGWISKEDIKKYPGKKDNQDGRTFNEDWQRFDNYIRDRSAWQWAKLLTKFALKATVFGVGVNTFFKPEVDNFIKERRKCMGFDDLRNHIAPNEWDKTKLVERNAAKQLEKLFEERSLKEGIAYVAITSDEGMGKSEVSNEYADRYYKQTKERWPDKLRTVVTLHADDLEIFKGEFSKFAAELGVDIKNKESPKIIAEVHKKLQKRPGWMVILDNIDAQDFQSIKKYIPHGHKQKGQVIFTTRSTPKQINERIGSDVEIFDLNKEGYRFTEHEAVQLFNKVTGEFGDRGWKQKAMLARELKFSPLAIRKAAAFIVTQLMPAIATSTETLTPKAQHTVAQPSQPATAQKDTAIDKYLREFSSQYSQLKTKYSSYSEYQLVNLATNLLAINQLSLEANYILSFIAFLNPDKIEEFLFRQDIIFHIFDNSQTRLYTPKLEERLDKLTDLKTFYLLDRNDGTSYKMHRSVKEAILEWGAERTNQSKERYELDKLSQVVTSLKKFCSRSGIRTNESENNALLIPHVQMVYSHANRLKAVAGLEEQITQVRLDSIFFLVAASNQYMYKGQTLMAKQLLDTAKRDCEKIAGITNNNPQDIPTMCRELAGYQQQKPTTNLKLPVLYSIILYQSGRLYLYTKDLSMFGQATQDISYAMAMRAEIDADKHPGRQPKIGYSDDPTYSAEKDTLVFEQNGSLCLLSEPYHLKGKLVTSKTRREQKDDLIKAKNRYETLLVAPENSNDFRCQATCNHYLAMVNQKLAATICFNSSERNAYLQAARNNINEAININVIKAELNKNTDYENTKASILIDIGATKDIAEAESLLKDIITRGNGQSNASQANAYTGLARIYLLQEQYTKALEEANKSIKIQKEMQRLDEHPDLQEAKKVLKHVRLIERANNVALG